MPAPPFALTAEAHAARARAAACAWHAAHGEGVDDGAWPRGLRRGALAAAVLPDDYDADDYGDDVDGGAASTRPALRQLYLPVATAADECAVGARREASVR